MKQYMKQRDFVNVLATKGYTKKDAKQVVEDVITTLMECLAEEDEIHFHGFGVFSVIDVKEHESVTVDTQERIVIPGYKAPKFQAGKRLKRAVREGFLRE